MKRFGTSILAILALSASSLFAAAIDGKWQGEMKTTGKKAAKERVVSTVFDFKSEGNALKGTVSMGKGKRGPGPVEIKDGKVEGDKVSFTTVVASKKKGDRTVTWEGTVSGDELKVTASGAKKKGSTSLTLKRG